MKYSIPTNLGKTAYSEETYLARYIGECTGFYSCALGDKDMVDTTYLDFSDLMKEIERRRYNCKPPEWVTRLIKTKEKKNTGEKKKKVTESDGSRNLRIFNSNMADQCRLAEDEQYKFMFNPRSLKDLQRSKKKVAIWCVYGFTPSVTASKIARFKMVMAHYLVRKKRGL